MKFLLIAILCLAGATALADVRNLAECNWTDADGGPNRVVIHQDAGGQLVALYTTESFGGSYPTFPYKVSLAKTSREGAGLTYEGRQITVHIGTDVRPANGIIPGWISMPSMNLKYQKADCKLID